MVALMATATAAMWNPFFPSFLSGLVCFYVAGNHGIIASKRCNDVSIQNNVVYDNGNAGIMLHRSSNTAIVRNNTITNNGDSCIAIFESNGEHLPTGL